MRKQLIEKRLKEKLASKTTQTVCLAMIVKNESKIILRLLTSLLGKIDMISIVDTGSSDNTKEIIEDFGKQNKIPTAVHCEEFKNFCYNRTHSVKKAQETFPKATFILLSDADFIWEGDFPNKNFLIEQGYSIEQYSQDYRYWNTRLLKANIDWECKGVTHEFWRACKNQTKYQGTINMFAKITSLRINDQEDGGCKLDKFERDERLLKEALANPKNEEKGILIRYKFYLAQTLRTMGKYDESNEWYLKRIEDKDYDEEVYFCYYKIGTNYEHMAWKHLDEIKEECKHKQDENDDTETDYESEEDVLEEHEKYNETAIKFFNLAKEYFKKAYHFRKTRAEALYALTRLHRIISEHSEAYRNALIGKKIKYPSNDNLFIEANCYDYLFDYEISIVAPYIGKKEIGAKALGKLLARKHDLPSHILKTCEHNAQFYI